MKRFASLVLLLVLAGCFRSLQPIYTPDDVVFDAALLGEWVTESETWTISRAGGKAYRIVHADESGRAGIFLGHLVEIEGHRFIDLLPVQTDARSTHLHFDNILPLHTVALVVRTTPTPQIATPRGDWFRDHVRARPDSIEHQTVDGHVVVTASPREIQAFLLRNVSAFEADPPWRRAN